MNWTLEFNVHWPHDRLALGWEYIGSDKNDPVRSYTVFLTILTISFHLRDQD